MAKVVYIPKIFLDRYSENAGVVFKELGAKFVPRWEQADIIWIRHNYKNIWSRLRPFQSLNHIPGENFLINKGEFRNLLVGHAVKNKTFDFLKTFYPETYWPYNEKEISFLLKRIPQKQDKSNPWLLKPTHQSRGVGIKILWDFEYFRKEMDHILKSDDGPYVVQRYLKDLLLLDGRKSEIRVYLLILNLKPINALMYWPGQVRLNSQEFKLDDFDNPLIHLTNVYQQKQNPGYDENLILKWSFDYFEKHLQENNLVSTPNYLEKILKEKIKKILSYVLLASNKRLNSDKFTGSFYGLYGVDFILDNKLNPWLTEIQIGPGLSMETNVKRNIVLPLLEETIRLVIENQVRNLVKMPLGDYQAQKGFEVLQLDN